MVPARKGCLVDPRVTLLRETMKEQGRQGRWLAQRLSIANSTLSRYLHGDRTMPEAQLCEAMRLVGLPYHALNVTGGTELVPNGASHVHA